MKIGKMRKKFESRKQNFKRKHKKMIRKFIKKGIQFNKQHKFRQLALKSQQ